MRGHMIAFSEILPSLERLSPYFGSQLRKSWDGTLRTHIEAVSKHRNLEGGQSIASARSALALELQDPLKKQNFSQQALNVARNALFHSGPHLRLLTEPRTFNALMYAALVAQISKNDVVIWYQDSTTSLEQRPRCGPGWLESKQHQIWLFDIARKSNCRTPTLTNAEAVRLSPELHRLQPDTPISNILKRTLDHLTSTEWRSYADALQDINSYLWQQTFGRHGLRLLQIDTRFTARLVARHCLTSTSLIFKLLFEEPLRNLCKKEIERLSASELEEFVNWNTDWFWFVEGNRRFALILQNGRLYRSGDEGDYICSFEPEALAQKLQSGELIPNLF